MIDADYCRRLIRGMADAKPRSRQVHIGPSELGGPCARRLVYRLSQTPKVNSDADPLAAWIGTAVHAEIEKSLGDEWGTELPVSIPEYGIAGTLDAYHRPTRTVLDWKVVGDTTLRKVRTAGPGEQYRTQVHAYALGASLAGYDVDNVAVCFIPRSGRLSSLVLWSEPYDPDVVEAPLRRFEQLKAAADIAGSAAAAMVPTGDAFCTGCPWFLPGATNPAEACPGHIDPGDMPVDPTQPNRKDPAHEHLG